MDNKGSFSDIISAIFDRTSSAIRNEHIVSTIIIQEISPYLHAKIDELFTQCGFKKLPIANNAWIFKSLGRYSCAEHKKYIAEIIEKNSNVLCTFNSKEFPIVGLIHISGDIYGVYNITISCEENDSSMVTLTSVEW